MSDKTRIADDVFLALIGDSHGCYDEFTEVRSAPHSDSVDIQIGGQWYRLHVVEIEEPIEACNSSGCQNDNNCEGHDD